MKGYTPKTHGKSGVYKITINETNQIYFGSSKHIYRRWKQHEVQLRKGNHSTPDLQEAYNRHGLSGITFDVISFCDNYRDQEEGILAFAVGNSWCLNQTKLVQKSKRALGRNRKTKTLLSKMNSKAIVLVNNKGKLTKFSSQKKANMHFGVDLKKYMAGIRPRLPQKLQRLGYKDAYYA